MIRRTPVFLTLCLATLAGTVDAPGASAEGIVIRPSDPTHGVGTRFVHWTDPDREEAWTVDPSDRREVGVRLWYPAEIEPARDRTPLILEEERVSSAITAAWGGSPKGVEVEARENARMLSGGGPFPVVLLSHGGVASYWNFTSLAVELASRGYLVAAIEHTYWALPGPTSSGELIALENTATPLANLDFDEFNLYVREAIDLFSEDQWFVARRIRDIANGAFDDPIGMRGNVDVDHLAAIGHSLGGMAVDRSCLRYSGITAGVSLDGTRWLPVLAGREPHASGKPFLLLFSEQFWRPDPGFARRYLDTWDNMAAMIVNGGRHGSFVDVDGLIPGAAFGKTEAEVHTAMLPVIVEFLENSRSAGYDATLLHRFASESLTVVDWDEMAVMPPKEKKQ